MRLLTVPTVLLVLVAGTSCGGSFACTDVGHESGVSFGLGTLPATDAPWEVTGCVQEVCDSFTMDPVGGAFFVPDDALEDGATVLARLRVVGASGRTVVDDEIEVTPVRYEPDGEGLEPCAIAVQAHLTVTADGALRELDSTT